MRYTSWEHAFEPEQQITRRAERRMDAAGRELFRALLQANDDARDLRATGGTLTNLTEPPGTGIIEPGLWSAFSIDSCREGMMADVTGRQMAFRVLRSLALLTSLLFTASLLPASTRLTGGWPPTAGAATLPYCSAVQDSVGSPASADQPRRVNAPYFDGDVQFSEAAVFWFGHVTPTHNSADVRVGYNDEHLFLHVAAFDRRLWYDTSPTPDTLTDWDAVSLYLDTDGNVVQAPDASAYRFEGQLVWWEDREAAQAAFQGDDGTWIAATVPFTTTSGWRGNAPLDDEDDRGWWLAYRIPFESLGLAGPPQPGDIWGLALTLHDRDDAAGTPIVDKIWPEAMDAGRPATWGQLVFGLPAYTAPPAFPGGTVTVRQGLDGAAVIDAAVGGGTDCGSGLDFWTEWGQANYAALEFFNIQNQADVADWPCFSKYYLTFPLDALPAAADWPSVTDGDPTRTIISATLTLHLFGSAGSGWDPGPQPSLIQVLTIDEGWDEDTLTWNNAPLAWENVSAAWVDPVDDFPGWPGVPWMWDVSRAVAEAYAAGQPLRLALYEADWAYHSGKYFVSSDAEDWNEQGRPTLDITWGYIKTASPMSGNRGEPVTYSLSLLGSGQTLTLTDTLPAGVGQPGDFQLEGTEVHPTYDSDHHRLTWSDSPPAGQEVSVRYVATITASGRQTLVNVAKLQAGDGRPSTTLATVNANPRQNYVLPLILGAEY